jgi:hypothetical protein
LAYTRSSSRVQRNARANYRRWAASRIVYAEDFRGTGDVSEATKPYTAMKSASADTISSFGKRRTIHGRTKNKDCFTDS